MMAVYVDNAKFPLGRMKMCHMIADTEVELHEMAEWLGLKRAWFQNERYPHYDISQGKRALALQYGAIEISREQFVERAKCMIAHRKEV